MAVSAATGSDLEQQALGSYCRHLVALCIRYQQLKDGVPLGEVQFLACPGTVICIRGFCSFLTAGHALKHWDTIIQQGKVSVRSAVLADIFGTGATSQQPIPFDFSDEPRYYIDDEAEGLDFGLIALRPYHVRLLAKNGIKAVFEENWIHQHRVEFDGCDVGVA